MIINIKTAFISFIWVIIGAPYYSYKALKTNKEWDLVFWFIKLVLVKSSIYFWGKNFKGIFLIIFSNIIQRSFICLWLFLLKDK